MPETARGAYELMIKTNHYLIKGGDLLESQKAGIAGRLLAKAVNNGRAGQFYNRVSDGREMYPSFYIPPYNNGKKCQTVIPMSPKTRILADNAYELEILRLLFMFAGQNEAVRHMVRETLNRLKRTCFGYKGCAVGECFEAGVASLRFICAAAAYETDWIKKQVSVFNRHYTDKRRHSGVLKYYWLCLSEMPVHIGGPEIIRHKDTIINQLQKESKSKSGKDIHQVLASVMENALARLPEYIS